MRSFSKKLAFVLAAAMVVTAFAPAASAKAADEMAINKQGKILYVTDGKGINDAAQVGGGKGNVSSYDFAVSNKPANWKSDYTFAWSSSDKTVIDVKNGGLTTAVGVGEADVVCVVTEKATGKSTTLKNTVTVKANAADVEIKNAEDWADLAYEVGDSINLDRVMYDAEGNKTSKRGTLVTDYTRWMAEPATGVEINQKNGTYTFTEDAEAGEYTLWCETYQSKKYTGTTATSEKITVTLTGDYAFTTKQTNHNSFVINFESAVKELGTVEVIQLIEAGDTVYEFPQVVNTVKLADDKMSATVTMFSNFVDKYNYLVKVGEESDTMTASVGAPDSMKLSAKADAVNWPLVDAGDLRQLYYRLYDVNGVDVTELYPNQVIFTEKTYADDASYYVSGDKIWFEKAGLSATVVGEFQSNKYDDNGDPVGNVKAEFTFTSKNADATVIQGVTKATLNYSGADKGLSVPLDTTDAVIKLQVKASSQNDAIDVTKNGQDVAGVGTITFEETNPNQIAIDKTEGQAPALYLFKEGASTVVVNLNTVDGNGNAKKTPIYAFTVTVTAKRALSEVKLDKTSVTVGTQDGLDTDTLTISAKDQYQGNVGIDSVVITATNNNSKKAVDADGNLVGITEAGGKISVDGSVLADYVFEAGSAATVANLTYKVKVNNNKEVSFTVIVKKPVEASKSLALEITDGAFGDVGRYVSADGNTNTEKAKSVTVSAFVMSNGVKFDTQDIAKAPASADNATVGNYYVKVTKDGKDVTSSVSVTGNAVTINFSTTETKDIAEGASGSAVKYDLGAGNYVVTLYKCEKAGEKNVLRQVRSLSGATTCTTKAYTLVKRTSETATSADAAALRACFEINGVDGKKTANENYVVTTKGDVDSGYVYVESISFYDDLGDDTYAGYTVNIGVSIKIVAE